MEYITKTRLSVLSRARRKSDAAHNPAKRPTSRRTWWTSFCRLSMFMENKLLINNYIFDLKKKKIFFDSFRRRVIIIYRPRERPTQIHLSSAAVVESVVTDCPTLISKEKLCYKGLPPPPPYFPLEFPYRERREKKKGRLNNRLFTLRRRDETTAALEKSLSYADENNMKERKENCRFFILSFIIFFNPS